MSVAMMAASLFATNEGYLDDVPADKIVDFEAALHASFIDGVPDLVQKINDTGDYNDEIEGELKKFIETL